MTPILKTELRVRIPIVLKETIESNAANLQLTMSHYVENLLSDALLVPIIPNAQLHDFIRLEGLQLINTQEYLRVHHPEIHIPYLQKGVELYEQYICLQNSTK